MHSGYVNDVDAVLSREATEALNVSMPEVVKAAGRARLASNMILVPVCGAFGLCLLSAIFGSVLASTPGLFVAIMAAFVILIGVMIAGFVVGLRAKRAFKLIAEAVGRERQATVVRVVNREVRVRR